VNVWDITKAYYSVSEVLQHLNITVDTLRHWVHIYNIETKSLPGSKEEHISASDVRTIEESVKRTTQGKGGISE
jgi:hypothetical protein